MTSRETIIAKKILAHLHELEGGQEHPLSTHAQIGGLNVCGSQEFEAVLGLLDQRQFIVTVQSKFKGKLISISDAGEAALLQM